MDELSIITGPEPEQNQDTPKSRRLSELEQIVEKGKATFLEVGAALAEIRANKLYKPRKWTVYLQERFGFTRQRAHQIMQAAKYVQETSTVVDEIPTERVIRKKLSEKRSKPKQPAKAKSERVSQPDSTDEDETESGRIINDAEEELDRFKAIVRDWRNEFLPDELRQLLEQVKETVDEILESLPEEEPALEEVSA